MDEKPSRWKRVLLALAAVGAAVAAVVAWGRASPVPEADETEEVVPEVVPTEPSPRQAAPPWVRPTILWTVALVVAIGVAFYLLGVLQQVVAYLLLALFFSFALEPAVNWLGARGWRRGTATGLLLAVVFLLLLVLVLVFVPTLLRGTRALVEQVPQWAQDVETWASDNLGVDVSTAPIAESAQDASASLADTNPISALIGFTVSLVGGVFALFTVAMFVFYMVAEAPKFKRAVLSFFPEQRQEELVSIWEAAIEKTGGYFYSRLLLAVINGGLFFIVLRLADVPGAAALALFQGFVAAFIPIVGTYIAAIVPLTAAFFAVGMPETAFLLAYELVYQQIENYLISPKIQGKTMQLHPAVAFGAALAGGAIGGLLWAFLALPFAATVQASASLWFERHEVVETEFTTETVRVVVRDRSEGNRVARWLRSSRGWLRRKEPTETEVDVEVGVPGTPDRNAAAPVVADDATAASVTGDGARSPADDGAERPATP